MRRKVSACVLFSILLLLASGRLPRAFCWGNGGFSDDPSNPDYGTHDWIAQHALEMLPFEERVFLVGNETIFKAFLYGTELPDNGGLPDGIGDTTRHHIYFGADGVLEDDVAADRASEEYASAVNCAASQDWVNMAKHLGAMAHYISDLAVFGHVMGADTDWGAEVHHSGYEDYVATRTDSPDDEFDAYLVYDGASMITAYDAAVCVANDTTFDLDGDLTCVWMDQNYDWSNTAFKNRCGESLNLATNAVADVLHTFYSHVIIPEYPPGLTVLALLLVTTVAVLLVKKGKRRPA